MKAADHVARQSLARGLHGCELVEHADIRGSFLARERAGRMERVELLKCRVVDDRQDLRAGRIAEETSMSRVDRRERRDDARRTLVMAF